MFGQKKGTFVLCNCDRDICDVVKVSRLFGDNITAEKGPEICVRDDTKCLGLEKCGKCINRCPFNANLSIGDKVIFDKDKCMGCELCVTTCEGKARMLAERDDYKFDHIMNKKLLLAGKYGYDRLVPYCKDNGGK